MRWQAFGAVNVYGVVAVLLEFDQAETADHIGQQIDARVADFVQQLLADAQRWYRQRPASRQRNG